MNITTEKRGHKDWWAVDADSYDGAPDSNTNFVGFGDTEAEAIEDLKRLLGEEEEDESSWRNRNL